MKYSLEFDSDDILDEISNKIINIFDIAKVHELDLTILDVLNGNTILLIDGCDNGLSIDTVGFKHRNVERSQNETIIKGPQEAFTESGSVNRSLIRKQLRSPDLITEFITIGETSKCLISVLYLKNVVNPDLLNKVKNRINDLSNKVDGIEDTSILEQYLEERPYSPIPTILFTERPDRASAFIKEGHIVILTDHSPNCIIAPVTFWSFFHSGSDMYDRWIYGNFNRTIRMIAFIVSLLTPSIYLAITNFHPGSIPVDLLLSIAATREIVPFPAYIEVLIMEISFELVREAGVRIPQPIGPTIGIVGALILGQAAVEANIVSPILVIIVAITGIGSFALPDNNASYAIRIGRFLF